MRFGLPDRWPKSLFRQLGSVAAWVGSPVGRPETCVCDPTDQPGLSAPTAKQVAQVAHPISNRLKGELCVSQPTDQPSIAVRVVRDLSGQRPSDRTPETPIFAGDSGVCPGCPGKFQLLRE